MAVVMGPPTRGADLNGHATMRADAAGEMLSYQLKDIPKGPLWFFWYGKPLLTTSDQAFVGHKWPSQKGGVAAYLCSTGSAKSVAMGNGFGDWAPRFYTPMNSISDTVPTSLLSALGMANAQRVNGDDIPITSSLIEDAPAYPSGAWVFLHSGASHEVVNADTLVVIFGTGTLDDPDIERLEGWAHWAGGSQAMLVDHPYSDAPPMLDETPPEPGEPVEVDVSGQIEREGRVIEFEGTIELREAETS
jgi:hypothetical protein